MSKDAVAPRVMLAGATGTIGALTFTSLQSMGCRPTPVTRKEFDLRSDVEVGVALLAGKPDIVINATSELGGGVAQAFRGPMAIAMNLIHACAAGRIRLVQLQAPRIVWPWEDLHTIRALMNVQDAIQTLQDAYVAQHKLNTLTIRLPMVYALNGRRTDALSVIIAHLCKAAVSKAEDCQIPFHPDHPFSMIDASDAGAAVAELSVSDQVGSMTVPGPAPMACGDIVAQVVQQTKYAGKISFHTEPRPEAEPEQDPKQGASPITVSMSQGIEKLTQFMMDSLEKQAKPGRYLAPAAKE